MTGRDSGSGRVTRQPDLGWQRHAAQAVQVVSVPGNHVSMMRAPHVQALADAVASVVCPTTQGEVPRHLNT